MLRPPAYCYDVEEKVRNRETLTDLDKAKGAVCGARYVIEWECSYDPDGEFCAKINGGS